MPLTHGPIKHLLQNAGLNWAIDSMAQLNISCRMQDTYSNISCNIRGGATAERSWRSWCRPSGRRPCGTTCALRSITTTCQPPIPPHGPHLLPTVSPPCPPCSLPNTVDLHSFTNLDVRQLLHRLFRSWKPELRLGTACPSCN